MCAGKSLSTETEIKIKIEDAEEFCRRLDEYGPRIVSAKHFEDNRLFDFPDGTLGSGRRLLRIRVVEDSVFLTYKGPPAENGIFKTREELEVRLKDGATIVQILERIGMHVSFRYQKYRSEFFLDGVHVAVDETPVGSYVEFEGSEDAILELALKMGIAESRFLRLSYYALYLDYCKKRGEVPHYMTF
jgi:adenylate cyclase class 2